MSKSDDLTIEELFDLWPRDIKQQLDKRVARDDLESRSQMVRDYFDTADAKVKIRRRPGGPIGRPLTEEEMMKA
jgi:hypothetical protein